MHVWTCLHFIVFYIACIHLVGVCKIVGSQFPQAASSSIGLPGESSCAGIVFTSFCFVCNQV